MGEFDKLKNDAEQYAQQHPQQVKEGEQAVEKDLGLQNQGGGQQDQGGGQGAAGGGGSDQSSAQQGQ
jgi:hypothetical protein